MTIDRKEDPLFILLLDEARALKLEDAEECICIECLINVIETFWKNKRIAAKLDFLDKLLKLTNKLLEYISKLNLEESQKLLKLNDELKEKFDELELERIRQEELENSYTMQYCR